MYTSVIFFMLQMLNPVAELPAEKPFVIVELFTSEGCSSCPSADQLLSEIVDEQQSDVEVIGLSFHVDYWDYIGWKDPYARREFTQRQRTYASKLQSYQVYTPQMVVNGKHEFVGSDRRTWTRVLGAEAKGSPDFNFELEELTKIENQLTFSVTSQNPQELLMNVALVERGLSQQVTRGENRGRKLHHDNVVRSFTVKQATSNTQELSIDIPSDLNTENSALVVYFQKASNYEIVGAQQVTLASLDASN